MHDQGTTTLAAGVRLIQQEVEARYGVAVEAVTVGDCGLDDQLDALLAAAREATVNAAKWSGADVISLFAEVEPTEVSVFVRDRGRGFDPAAVPGDRKGLAESVRARMVRRGGSVVVRSALGDGTEVSLRMPRVAGPASAEPGMTAASPSGPAGGCPRVFIVDDHGLFRAGVRAELGDRVEVVGEADDVGPAITQITASLPDVVLLDVHLPSGGGQAVVSSVKAAHPEVRFLALSASDAPEDVIAVIRAGARGYVTKTISTAELVDAVRRVAAGDTVFSPMLAGFVLDAFAALPTADEDPPSFDPELDQLTAREREVLRLIARGYTYKEIARELYISAKTVEHHVSSVLRKLQLSTRHQLTRWATERRLA